MYKHFIYLHCAIRLLCGYKNACQNSDYAAALLKYFVRDFAKFYGQEYINYNVHNLLHLADCVKQFGPLQNFNGYKFENYLQIIKRRIKKPTNILAQIVNRQSELWKIYQKSAKRHSEFLASGFKKSCFMLKEDIPFSIENMKITTTGEEYIVGKRFINCSNFYVMNTPFHTFYINSLFYHIIIFMFFFQFSTLKNKYLPKNE